MTISSLPALNALLNSSCAFLLLLGYFFIRNKKITAHKISMGSAFVCSIFFLISYLTYHAYHCATPFPGRGWIRPLYFGILLSHTILAVIIPPLAIRTLYLAWRNRIAAHRKLARWTLPIWLYVSVTGVIIYWMLYRVKWL